MPAITLPDDPNLEQLRKRARALQRAVRSGEPTALSAVGAHHPGGSPQDPAAFTLSAAQLVVARSYGFASWPRLKRHLDVVARHRRDLDSSARTDPAEDFCRLACLAYDGDDGPGRWARARELLAEYPGMTRGSIWAAAAASDPSAVRRLRHQATEEGGPHGLTPLLYLAYSRVGGSEEDVLTTARLLLEAGADPDDGFLWKGLPTPFTVLTGVFGEGESGPGRRPRHPHSQALARLLLEAGADPNDGQALYNRMFGPDDDHLELLFAYGLGTGDGGPWRARLGDALDEPEAMVRGQLGWAVDHGFAGRVRLLVAHGVDVRSPLGDGRTPVEAAVMGGHPEIVALLTDAGAEPPAMAGVDALAAACLAADRTEVARLTEEDTGLLARTRATRPALVLEAAEGRRAEALTLLGELGFDVDAQLDGALNRRLRLGVDGGTALHWAAWRGDLGLARRLLDLGADPAVRDTRFGMTPLEWARHASQDATAAYLAPLTGKGPTGRPDRNTPAGS